MDKKQYIWDPLRKKEVVLTEEEKVRQWFIRLLNKSFDCPLHLMNSECFLTFGKGSLAKKYRADIVLYDRNANPMMVVECKEPNIKIDKEVLNQALRYAKLLEVNFVALTNGKQNFLFSRIKDEQSIRYEQRYKFLTYNEMIEEYNGG